MKAIYLFSRTRYFIVCALAVTLFLLSGIVQGQDRWSFEFRPGVNLPTKKLGETDLKTGYGFEGDFAYRFMPHLSIYGGWSWNRFGSDQSFAGAKTDFEETGYTYGLQFIHPIGSSKINALLRAGGLVNHIEIENTDGDIIADSGHGMGWQIEAGLTIPLGETWRLMPSLRYRSLARDIELGNATTSVDLNYLSLGVGISKIF